MLNEALARSFIEQLGECTDYSIHIINKSGFVLASSDPNGTGMFHEIAFKMVQENIPTVEVDNDRKFLGVKPGIHMLFYYHKKPAGIIAISGAV